jgi:hypothetical protein
MGEREDRLLFPHFYHQTAQHRDQSGADQDQPSFEIDA